MHWGPISDNMTEGLPNEVMYENKHFIIFEDNVSLIAYNFKFREKWSITVNTDYLFLKGPAESALILWLG